MQCTCMSCFGAQFIFTRWEKDMPAWLSKFIEKWQSQSRATQWTIIGILSIALLLIVIPWRASADENNPLGIEASSNALSGSNQYSAAPLSISEGAQGVSLGNTSSSSSAAVNLDESVSITKDATYSEDLAALTQEYESFSSELAVSRSNDPSYVAPSVSGGSSSSTSTSTSASASSSTATSSTSVTEESSSVSTGASTYTVQSGDNAYRIAVDNGLTLEEFLSLNGKTEAVVTPGEVVRVQ